MERLEAISLIKSQIPKCLDGNLNFAFHSLDQQRAEELRNFAKNEAIKPEEVILLFSNYLLDQQQLIKERYPEEMERIRDFFDPKA